MQNIDAIEPADYAVYVEQFEKKNCKVLPNTETPDPEVVLKPKRSR
jgi:hypothetical protein